MQIMKLREGYASHIHVNVFLSVMKCSRDVYTLSELSGASCRVVFFFFSFSCSNQTNQKNIVFGARLLCLLKGAGLAGCSVSVFRSFLYQWGAARRAPLLRRIIFSHSVVRFSRDGEGGVKISPSQTDITDLSLSITLCMYRRLSHLIKV